ncbi:CobW family GTP-binding protein [Brevibacterium senegalense]|uniref:CobW family GTP-binding protein n=1 Tax=Brevibacterium senegalense TaxID=1033736 RepID=UPI00031B3C24|nr:GTP-binding protein [Brevibacterium senegalense]
MAHNDGDPPPSKPLTLVGGYLGSGKTTLINRFLASPDAGRTAVVVNDFGDVNIDAALIRAAGADTLELTNGCICCQITDDVQTTMAGLAARTDIDAVICEVSGIGDPSQLGTWRSYPGFRPGPVVVCADAGATEARLTDEYVEDVVRAQLASADVVLVTKADLMSADQVERVREVCARLAPSARVVTPVEGSENVLVAAVGNTAEAAAGVVRGAADDAEAAAGSAPHAGSRTGIGSARGTEAGSHPSEESHAQVHRTRTVDLPPRARAGDVAGTLRAHATMLVRAKGFARDADGGWQQVHLAGGNVTASSLPAGSPTPDRPQIVLIAAGPDAQRTLDTVASQLDG